MGDVKPKNAKIENKGFSYTWNDFYDNIAWYNITIGAVIIVLAIEEYLIIKCCGPLVIIDAKIVCDLVLKFYPSMVALSFAIISLIISLKGKEIQRLQEIAQDGKRPFDVFCATVIWFLSISIITILMAVATMMLQSTMTFVFLQWLIIYSLIELFDILLHIYSARTFFMNNQISED